MVILRAIARTRVLAVVILRDSDSNFCIGSHSRTKSNQVVCTIVVVVVGITIVVIVVTVMVPVQLISKENHETSYDILMQILRIFQQCIGTFNATTVRDRVQHISMLNLNPRSPNPKP